MYAFIFPGQGSQSVGMGREIYQAFPEAREVFQEVEESLRQKITSLIFEGPMEDLTLTENTQPALMTVSLAIVRVLEKAGFVLSEKGRFLAGHSLGEYSALCAGGTLTLSETAPLLKIRGRAMQEAVPAGKGAMAAVLGLDLSTVQKITEEASSGLVCSVANDNSPGQVVISGHKEAIQRAMTLVSEVGGKSIPLPVSAPFHCALMESAALKMKEALAPVSFRAPCLPLIPNVTALPEENPAMLKALLVQQVTGHVRWRESILSLKAQGVTHVVELGAGKVLSGLAKRIDAELHASSVNTPQAIEELVKST